MRLDGVRQQVQRSVVQSNVPKQIGHGLIILDTSYSLGQHNTDIHCFNFVTLHFLDLMRDCVSDYNLQKMKIYYQRHLCACVYLKGHNHTNDNIKIFYSPHQYWIPPRVWGPQMTTGRGWP